VNEDFRSPEMLAKTLISIFLMILAALFISKTWIFILLIFAIPYLVFILLGKNKL